MFERINDFQFKTYLLSLNRYLTCGVGYIAPLMLIYYKILRMQCVRGRGPDPFARRGTFGWGCAEPLPIEKYGDMWCVIEHSNSRFESIRFDSLRESIRID